MPDFVITMVAVGAFTALLFGVSHLLARRRRAALTRGQDVLFRVRLAGTQPPYPSRPRRGRLRVGPSGLMWTASAGSLALDLTATGIRPIGQRDGRIREGTGSAESVVTAADGMGVPLRLIGSNITLEQVAEVLRERGVPEQPVPAMALPGTHKGVRPAPAFLIAATVVVLSLMGGAFTVWAGVSGVQVTATVVSEPDSDDYCTVRWIDPRDGRAKENGADCYWEVGDEVEFVALGDPLRGEVVELEDVWAWAIISGVVGVSAAAVPGVRHWRRRRDAQRPVHQSTPVKAPPSPSVLMPEQLRYDEVAAFMRLRAGMEGWPFDVERPGASSPSYQPSKQVAWGAVSGSWPLAIGLSLGLLTGWSSFAGLWASAGPTAEVVATVADDPIEFFPFVPDDLEITFPLRGGGTSNTLVSVIGLPNPRPETLRVAYDLDDPDRVRALEHDGAVRGGTIGGTLILGGLGLTAWRWSLLLSVVRQERRARASGPGRFLQYVLVPDFAEELYLLLFDAGPQAPPGHLLLVADDVRGQVPGAGTAEVRGAYESGQVVVPLIDGRELATGSRLLEADLEEVLSLVNNVELTDADQD